MNPQQLNKMAEYCKPLYKHPRRHYHTWAHIESMVRCFHKYFKIQHRLGFTKIMLEDDERETMNIIIAIYFHDIVQGYKRDAINIDRSIDLLYDYCRKKGILEDDSDFHMVIHLIEATDYSNDLNELTSSQRIITDIDLHILATSRPTYIQYMQNIRKEYARYNDDEYRVGRSNVLRKLLKQAQDNQLFFYYPDWNRASIKNINYELSILEKQND